VTFASLSLRIFIPKGSTLFEHKNGYRKRLSIKIAFNLEESLKILDSFHVHIRIEGTLKIRGVKLHIPQFIFIVSR